MYDRETGQALTASFLDYGIPHARMIRHFDMTMDESTPCLNNAMGVKGVGELGTIGATPAVVNAVVDALARAGLGEAALAPADAVHLRARVARDAAQVAPAPRSGQCGPSFAPACLAAWCATAKARPSSCPYSS